MEVTDDPNDVSPAGKLVVDEEGEDFHWSAAVGNRRLLWDWNPCA